MSRLQWDAYGQRRFESGVDRGVLYVRKDNVAPVPWNGLVSVKEAPTGGTVTSSYYDGVKYVHTSDGEDYQATLEAFTYPKAFELCEGIAPIRPGLSAAYQPKIPFDLSYRTRIGNDLNGMDHGYKIHLVYNAMVKPSSKDHGTIKNQITPSNFSWTINATPVFYPGIKPSSHFIVDSTELLEDALAALEEIIYGTDSTEPHMPTVDELSSVMGEFYTFTVQPNEDGTYEAEGPESMLYMEEPAQYAITVPPAEVLDEDTYDVDDY